VSIIFTHGTGVASVLHWQPQKLKIGIANIFSAGVSGARFFSKKVDYFF